MKGLILHACTFPALFSWPLGWWLVGATMSCLPGKEAELTLCPRTFQGLGSPEWSFPGLALTEGGFCPPDNPGWCLKIPSVFPTGEVPLPSVGGDQDAPTAENDPPPPPNVSSVEAEEPCSRVLFTCSVLQEGLSAKRWSPRRRPNPCTGQMCRCLNSERKLEM